MKPVYIKYVERRDIRGARARGMALPEEAAVRRIGNFSQDIAMTTEELFETIVTIDNRMGLHARPATMLAKLSSGFAAALTLERLDGNGEVADCRSALSLMMLAAGRGTKLLLKASGHEAEEAFREAVRLFESRFNEEE